MKRTILLFFALVLYGPEIPAQETASYRTVENIAYRDAAGDAYIDSLCRLDLYYPIDKKGFPTVVWFHGGSLTGGKRDIPNTLRDKGFARCRGGLSPNAACKSSRLLG